MSLSKNVKFHSALKENLSSKKQLNLLWKQFMSSFGYEKYYNFQDPNINNIYNIINKDSYNISIKSFTDFLEENSISITDNNLTVSNNNNIDILSEAKIWIMFIIYMNYIYENKKGKNKNIIINAFNEAIKHGCDIISLFEFFLIFISNMKENDFNNIINIDNIKEIIPEEFIVIYHKKKNVLRNIFQKEENKYFDMRNSLTKFLTNEIMNTHSTIFSSSEKKEKKNIDLNNIIIISKDYLNKGFFIIFKDKVDSNSKENGISMINSFSDYDFEDEDDNYCLMPLLFKYQNYDQKIEANNTLNLINKSIYKNYTYYPHDIDILN